MNKGDGWYITTMDYILSIIVPVYNAERTIERTLNNLVDSIGKYENIEIILINDGSVDSSSNICERFVQKDKRIKYIATENRGVSSARNKGLELASGKNIMFVDADDFLINNILEDLLEIEDGKELISFSVRKVSCDDVLDLTNSTYKCILRSSVIPTENYIENVIRNGNGYVWNKVFKKDVVDANNIRFDEELAISEDMVFLIEYLVHINSVFVIEKEGYLYVQSCNGASINLSNKKWFTVINSYDKILKVLQQYSTKLSSLFVFFYCYMCCEAIARKKLTDCDTDITLFKNFLEKYYASAITMKTISRSYKVKLWIFRHFPKMFMGLRVRKYK